MLSFYYKMKSNNMIYTNVFESLKKLGLSSKTADSIASYSSIYKFYQKNIHIAYTIINNKEIWSMNQKKIEIPNSRKCSEHAEERLIKKINRPFYKKKSKNNKISIYSIRINKKGEIKCAKPCKECMTYMLNSKIKIKNILWYEPNKFGNLKIFSENPSKHIHSTCGISSGRLYHSK